MSNTYRRKKNKQRKGESGFWTKNEDSFIETWWINYRYNGNKGRALAKYYGDAPSGYYSPPSWFYREYYTVPERRKTKQVLHKVMRCVDYEDAPLFPLSNKPKEYYW